MVINKKKAAVFCFLAAFSGISGTVINSEKNSLDSQMMAGRWESEEVPYSQVSLFWPSAYEGAYYEIEKLHSLVSDKLKSEGYAVNDENVNVWLDAYSSEFTQAGVSVSENTGQSVLCSICGVSDEFFKFHPLGLLSGNYIYGGELREDLVVLDENTAWSLFNSFDVSGMNIYINGNEYEIAGVVRPESGSTEEMAYPSAPVVYMHYSSLKNAGVSDSLLCYEAVIPNPVENYAKNVILNSMGIDTMVSSDEDLRKSIDSLPCEIVDNTSRFKNEKLWNEIKSTGRGRIVSKPVAYPYWENAARVMTSRLSVLYALKLISAAAAVVMMTVFLFKCYMGRTWHLKDYIEKLTYKYTYKKKISDYIDISDNK